MILYHLPFMGDNTNTSLEDSRCVVLPFPYAGGISYGEGTDRGPDAILKESAYVELYDEVLETEPFRKGIFTASPPEIPSSAEKMAATLSGCIDDLLKQDKFIALLGGDHSISSAYASALKNKYGSLSIIQFDAHADLRDSYEDSKLSHACVMSRMRELTDKTLQIGIRSLSKEEADRIKNEDLQVFMMHKLGDSQQELKQAIEDLPDPVFITFDVDVFDWSVVRSTGTPEPGGMTWTQVTDILQLISKSKKVVGFDLVELSKDDNDKNSAFAVAKLAYRMIGMFAK